jgi:signal transduction histidine kinase
VRVKADGPGIAAAALPRIFEPFFQSRHGQRGQAGLGLTVVRELTLAHGGTIEVESVPDEGTTFTLCFPRIDGRTPAPRCTWQRRIRRSMRAAQRRSESAHHA